MIEIKDVTKSYGRHKVLQNVSFEIMKGELFGLLGPNGAGKSTLIDILTGIQPMDSGDILINGKSIKTDKVEIRKHLGLVPQDIALLEELNAVDNLEYFGGLYGLYGAELKDAQSRQYIFDYIQELAAQGTTILYTSHYMEEIEALCDRVFILDLGEEVAYGTKEEVKKLVGHTQTVVLTLDRIPNGFEESLKASENGVQHVLLKEETLEITVDQTIFSMMKLIGFVEQEQLVIKSLSIKETTLEEAFLQLTGKTLRD